MEELPGSILVGGIQMRIKGVIGYYPDAVTRVKYLTKSLKRAKY
jgi:hypothetical protein